MGRYKQGYSLYPRKSSSTGKIYWYYRAYTPDGYRTTGKTTGCISKAAARRYCDDLQKRGLLYNGQSQTFAQYAQGWFDIGSVWLQDKIACGTVEHPAISEAYIKRMRTDLANYLIPYFGKTKMEDMRPSLVKHFRTWMLREKRLAHKTVNMAISTLKIITDYALADNVVMFDPLRGIRALSPIEKKRDAFTMEEATKIFRAEWKAPETKLVNLIAACTGMRISEIAAIGKGNLHDTYIDLTYQIQHGRPAPLKTKEARKIPLIPELFTLLANRCVDREYAFSEIDPQRPYIHLRYVLHDLDMDATRIKRGLCFHSWRHFFNTFLLAESVAPIKVAAVLGHSTGVSSMQSRYTNFRPENMQEIYAAQQKLFDLLAK